jgi:hypothetical protein
MRGRSQERDLDPALRDGLSGLGQLGARVGAINAHEDIHRRRRTHPDLNLDVRDPSWP